MRYFFIHSVSILFTFLNFSLAQTSISQGNVSGTWTLEGSPYLINGEITISNDSTLYIEPGVLVEFQGHYKLNVQGRLLAIGTRSDTIIFTINDTSGFNNFKIPDGGWHGIRFRQTPASNDSSKIIYCKLQFGKALESIWPDQYGGAIYVEGFDKLLISRSLITNNVAVKAIDAGGGGIYCSDASPFLESVIISNNISTDNGGGISCWDNSRPTLKDVIIRNNISYSVGGGISCLENANPILENVTIDGNYSSEGGGMFTYVSNPSLTNNTISNNIAGVGGGILFSGGSVPSIINSTIKKNRATDGNGGGIICWNSDVSLFNVEIIENSASWGGAIHSYESTLKLKNIKINGNLADVAAGISAGKSGLQMDSCIVINNSSKNSTGLRINNSSFSLTNSIVSNNTATQYAAGGGFSNSSIGTVSNSLFAFNDANMSGENWNSGGVSVWSEADVNFFNCTFSTNSAAYGDGLTVGGGGIASITNCIFWDNSNDQIALADWNDTGGNLSVNYCDVQDGIDYVNTTMLSTITWGYGNIDSDPLFVDVGDNDFHLQDNSPCVGNGIDSIEINGIWYYCPVTDIDGNPRPNPSESNPDIGAFENSSEPSTIEDRVSLHPKEFRLFQNYPNPFNPKTSFKYQLPKTSNVDLNIYNLLGQRVTTLVSKKQQAGNYKVEWDATDFTSGVYFYRIKTNNGFEQAKKLLVVK